MLAEKESVNTLAFLGTSLRDRRGPHVAHYLHERGRVDIGCFPHGLAATKAYVGICPATYLFNDMGLRSLFLSWLSRHGQSTSIGY